MVTISSTLRIAILALGLPMGAVQVGTASAQDIPAQDLPQNGGAGIRSSHITGSGETVPNPGASQSSGTTSMDRGIERRNDEIQSSICKGC